jgi:hypothetical protein
VDRQISGQVDRVDIPARKVSFDGDAFVLVQIAQVALRFEADDDLTRRELPTGSFLLGRLLPHGLGHGLLFCTLQAYRLHERCPSTTG